MLPLIVALPLSMLHARAAEGQSTPSSGATATPRGDAGTLGPRERSVLEAMKGFEKAVLASDTVALKRIWAEDYTFVNARGAVVTRAQRLANLASGATDVVEAANQREITVHVYGDNAVLRQLVTLRGRYSGKETNTEVRCTFVWVWRAGRWQMVTNQLTPVLP